MAPPLRLRHSNSWVQGKGGRRKEGPGFPPASPRGAAREREPAIGGDRDWEEERASLSLNGRHDDRQGRGREGSIIFIVDVATTSGIEHHHFIVSPSKKFSARFGATTGGRGKSE